MSLIIDLPPQTDAQLRATAEAQGRAPEELAVEAVAERYSPLPTLDKDNAESRMFSALSDAKEAAQTLDRERGTNWTEVTGELIERLRLEAAGRTDADAT